MRRSLSEYSTCISRGWMYEDWRELAKCVRHVLYKVERRQKVAIYDPLIGVEQPDYSNPWPEKPCEYCRSRRLDCCFRNRSISVEIEDDIGAYLKMYRKILRATVLLWQNGDRVWKCRYWTRGDQEDERHWVLPWFSRTDIPIRPLRWIHRNLTSIPLPKISKALESMLR